VQVNDGRPRNVYYKTDLSGQVYKRDEVDTNAAGDPHEIWYRFGGKEMGYIGNNGTSDVSFAQSIAARTAAPPTGTPGAFRNGSTGGASYGLFDSSLDKINSFSQGSGAGGYTARAGESLQSIAASLWGDSSLWYKLAEANGLSGAASLREGQILRLPAGVIKNTHNASTFSPYDPGEAIGDTSPTTPKPPKKNKCGAMGQILLTVIAIVVARVLDAYLPGAGTIVGKMIIGATSSAVSQVVGVATGIQEKFSWNQVALAGISAGVGKGLENSKAFSGFVGNATSGLSGNAQRFAQSALVGATQNALTQGIGMAVGVQRRFDFAGVAAAGIGAGIGGVASGQIGGAFSGLGKTLGGIATQITTGTASAIANAATRTALGDGQFGDNLRAAIPDVIGQAIAGAIGGKIEDARVAAKVDSVVRGASISGEAGDTQQTRIYIEGVIRAGGLVESAIEIMNRPDMRGALGTLDGVLAGGISEDVAAERALSLVLKSGADGGVAPFITVFGQTDGPSGEAILTSTISGGVQLLDAFASLHAENKALAEIALFGVGVTMGGPTKTIFKRIAGKAGEKLVDKASESFGNVVGGVVLNVATKHKWAMTFGVGGVFVQEANASVIAGASNILAATASNIALSASAGKVLDGVDGLKSRLMGTSSPNALSRGVNSAPSPTKATGLGVANSISPSIGHATPWAQMTIAQRKAFQHSYSRHAADFGLPNWKQSNVEDLQKQFNDAAAKIRNSGTQVAKPVFKPWNGKSVQVNYFESNINGENFYYYEDAATGMFISAGKNLP
jgi:LysM domain